MTNPFARAAIIALFAAMIAIGLMLCAREGEKKCPEGEIAVLGEDGWKCVRQGGAL